ncbi:hypothetical protein F3J02_13285 [Acinetobacter sp. Tr-809]|uniref:hypothetical protein n=1 Tax=Acinetobacter sp. Tr-809 TaxID=2608324 RepID=UPI00141EF336|nr:hypothetical protein [Acinetobacter sp. Tr-809]NIE97440.1 hypothetical protein [Acinetobacter sp. Tr-809]
MNNFKALGITVLTCSTLTSCSFFYKDGKRTNFDIMDKCSLSAKSGCSDSVFYTDVDKNTNERKTVAILEIDEQGHYINESYADKIIDFVKKENESDSKPVVLLFIHGWNHNSIEGDENLSDFKKIIKSVKIKNKDGNYRDVIGVYVSWRAKVYPDYLNKLATFWNRKKVSEDIGRGDLQRFILNLDGFLSDSKPHEEKPIFILAGHSFGASALYSAVSTMLLMRFDEGIRQQEKDSSVALKGVGDLVLLINPAVEVTRFAALREHIWKNGGERPRIFKNNLKPFFIVIGSGTDTDTTRYFPIGRKLNAWTENYRDTQIIDGISNKEKTVNEKSMDVTAIGNYAPYYTHWVVQYQTYISEFIEDNNIKPSTLNKAFEEPISREYFEKDLISEKTCEIENRNWLIDSVNHNSESENWSTAYKPTDKNRPKNQELIFKNIVKQQEESLSKHNKAQSVQKDDGLVDQLPLRISTQYIPSGHWKKNEPQKTSDYPTTWENNPYWFMRASDNVIQGHNGIWNRNFSCLVMSILYANSPKPEDMTLDKVEK